MTNIVEKWMPVKGYEGIYKVSNLGRIASEERMVELFGKGRFLLKKERVMKPKKHYAGYLLASFCKDGKISYTTYHRVVAENFIPNPCNKLQVNHKDGDKRNNAVSNLEWVTPSENLKHAFREGLKKPRTDKLGDKVKAKPIYAFCNGELVTRFDNICAAATHFNKPFRLFSKYFIKYGGAFAIQGFILSTKNEYEKDRINYFDADVNAMQSADHRI